MSFAIDKASGGGVMMLRDLAGGDDDALTDCLE